MCLDLRMPLAPEILAQITANNAAGLPAVWEAPIAIVRKNTQGRVAAGGAPEPIFEVLNRFIPGPTADLPIRIYRPSTKSNLPAVVFFHGGGWVLNHLDMYDAALSRLANQAGAVVISVAYQKAPEHPFPVPFNDCYSTLMWVIENAEDLKIDPTKVGIAGDSAGGNLVAGVALKARDTKVKLAFQIPIYPAIDRDFSTKSYQEMADGYGLTTKAMEWFWEQYIQDDQYLSDPYAVPAKANDFRGVAPAIVITAEYDPLLSDGEEYVRLLERDGVKTIYQFYAGMNHGFFINLAITPTATTAVDFAASEIKKLIQ
jgi:acetyl esterase